MLRSSLEKHLCHFHFLKSDQNKLIDIFTGAHKTSSAKWVTQCGNLPVVNCSLVIQSVLLSYVVKSDQRWENINFINCKVGWQLSRFKLAKWILLVVTALLHFYRVRPICKPGGSEEEEEEGAWLKPEVMW